MMWCNRFFFLIFKIILLWTEITRQNIPKVGHDTGQSIMLKDTQAEREQMVKDMANRCKGIIEEAMKWAPDTMRSHLKEYINNKVQIYQPPPTVIRLLGKLGLKRKS